MADWKEGQVPPGILPDYLHVDQLTVTTIEEKHNALYYSRPTHILKNWDQ